MLVQCFRFSDAEASFTTIREVTWPFSPGTWETERTQVGRLLSLWRLHIANLQEHEITKLGE